MIPEEQRSKTVLPYFRCIVARFTVSILKISVFDQVYMNIYLNVAFVSDPIMVAESQQTLLDFVNFCNVSLPINPGCGSSCIFLPV